MGIQTILARIRGPQRVGLGIHPSLPYRLSKLVLSPEDGELRDLANFLHRKKSARTGALGGAEQSSGIDPTTIAKARIALGLKKRLKISLPLGLQSKTIRGSVVAKQPLLLSQILELRDAAWKERGVHRPDILEWADPIDTLPNTFHYLISNKQTLVAACRITVHKSLETLQDAQYYQRFSCQIQSPTAQITRLVVSPEFQSQKIGLHCFGWVEDFARKSGAHCITCDVKIRNSSRWLQKIGYKILGAAGPQEGYPQDTQWIVICKKL